MTSPNDWEIKKCLTLCISLLLAMLGLIGLAALGFDIPVLRQIIGFVFLTFIPGMLILRVLKIHSAGIIECLLYSVGLSLAFVIATGVATNFALPPLGISHPIALAPLLVTFTIFFLILCFLAYVRDKNFRPANPPHKDSEEVAKPGFRANLNPFLLAILLPLLAILGVSLVNSYQNNILLIIFIFIIILIIGLVAFNKFIPPRVYPFMIVMIAIALLYQTTLISNCLVGSDIHQEYSISKLVIENGYWDATIGDSLNSCLSIVMLAPIYSLLLNMDIVWIFKIIYPLFFCSLPLALFRIFRLQIKPHYAFFATCFFISMPMFFMDLTQNLRQEISELFFVLVILLMVDRKLTLIQRTTLVLIFGFGTVVSHYGMGTGYIGYLVFGALVLIIIKSRPGRAIWQWLIGKRNPLPADLKSPGAFNKRTLAVIVGVSLVFMLGYYNVVASGAARGGIFVATSVGQSTVEQLVHGVTTPPATELPGFIQNITARFPSLNPLTKEPLTQTALGLDFPLASPGGKVWRIFQYLVQLCLVVGFIRLIFRPGRLGKLKAEYISLTIVSVFILLGLFVLPTTGYGMGSVRIFGITLLLLAPLFLFGGEVIGYGIVKLARVFRRSLASSRLSLDSPVLLRLLVFVILIPYFIFNSGVIFGLSRNQTTYFIDVPYSIALSGYGVDVSTVFTRQDVAGAGWLSKVAEEDYLVYNDQHGGRLLVMMQVPCKTDTKDKELSSPSYIYLRTWNTQKKMLTLPTSYAARQSISFADFPWLTQALEKGSKIYDNGGAQILLDR